MGTLPASPVGRGAARPVASTVCAIGCALVVLATACGDDSRQCGEGTNDRDRDGLCEPDDSGTICGDGTVLDPITGDCQVDPSVCGDGTVLLNGRCQDPATGLAVDLLEAPEPNGFETDAVPAGVITLPSVGDNGFTIHGCVKPLGNDSPDLDRYVVSVAGPTLIKIAADGVAGLAAGFVVQGDRSNPLLATWQRLGISVATDTSRREVFLPAAGTYDLVITDSRTLMPLTQGGGDDLIAAGDPEGTTCYYVTIDTRTIAIQPLDLATGDSGTIGEDLKFYNGTFPDGLVALAAEIDPGATRVAASLVVLDNTELRRVYDGSADARNADALFGGIRPGDDPLIVLDYVWNLAIQPVGYAITTTATLDSQALSIADGTINATSNGRQFATAEFDTINLFHFDVAGDREIDGVNLAASIPLQGVILDQGGDVVCRLTGLDGDASSSTTFDAYNGLLRTPGPGRYYLFVFAPRSAVATPFTIRSTIVPQTPAAVALDTPTNQTVGAFGSNALVYAPGTAEPWQLFGATGVNTGNLIVELYDPDAAFGRLDSLAIRSGAGAGVATTLPNDCATCDLSATSVVHEFAFAANGSNPAGRILKNPLALTPPAITNFVVKVSPANSSGVRSFTLDFQTRSYDDFAGPVLAPGATAMLANQTIDFTNRERRYYFETTPAKTVTITATPTGGPATLDVELARIDTTEVDAGVVNASATTGAETTQFAAPAAGFVAFKVRGVGASNGTYLITVTIGP